MAAVYRLAARWAATERNTDAARAYALQAVAIEPGNQEGKLLLARLQFLSGDEAQRAQGVRAMLELGREHTREGIEALKQLGTQHGIPLEVAEQVRVLLEQHPLATAQHRILAFSIELALHPEQSAALLDAAVQKYRRENAADRCAFGLWLQARGENERILTLLPVEEACKRQDLLRVCLNALAALKRWQEVERILEMRDVPLYPAIQELYLARVAEELGNKTRAELHWRRAHLAAARSPEMMREIGEYAEKCGDFVQAGIAYRSLSANANTARYAMERLLKIAQSRRDGEMRATSCRKCTSAGRRMRQ